MPLSALTLQETERLTDVSIRITALAALPVGDVVRGLLKIDNDLLLPLLADLAQRAGI